jgi:hypothetical protein
VKTNTVHTLFRVQKYGLMPLEQYHDILTPSDIKRCKKTQHSKKTWYSLNLHVFTAFIYQVLFVVDAYRCDSYFVKFYLSTF